MTEILKIVFVSLFVSAAGAVAIIGFFNFAESVLSHDQEIAKERCEVNRYIETGKKYIYVGGNCLTQEQYARYKEVK